MWWASLGLRPVRGPSEGWALPSLGLWTWVYWARQWAYWACQALFHILSSSVLYYVLHALQINYASAKHLWHVKNVLQLLLTDHLVGSTIVIGNSNIEIVLTLEGLEILTYLVILAFFFGLSSLG